MNTTVTDPSGATLYRDSRPIVSADGHLRVFEEHNPGAMVADYAKGDWKSVVAVEPEPEPEDIDWKAVADELVESIETGRVAQGKAIARYVGAVNREGS